MVEKYPQICTFTMHFCHFRVLANLGMNAERLLNLEYKNPQQGEGDKICDLKKDAGSDLVVKSEFQEFERML